VKPSGTINKTIDRKSLEFHLFAMNLARTPFQSWKFTRSIIISEKYEENMKKKKSGNL